MGKKKKIAAITASVTTAAVLLVAGAFAFFVDKDWTSDVGDVGTVYCNVENLVFTNNENINPGDYDQEVFQKAVTNGSTDTLRSGTEHKITFNVDNVGTKSVMQRNLITITVENTLFEPVEYGTAGYDKAREVAPDNHMYFKNGTNPLTIVEDELENKYIKGTEITFNDATGNYEYRDKTDGLLKTFQKNSPETQHIVHWKVGNVPASAFNLLYDVHLTGENTDAYKGINQNLVTETTEVDCIPTNNSLHSGVDLYALMSSDPTDEFEAWARGAFGAKKDSDIISIRYVTPQVSLTAPEGSIEDNDGTKHAQTYQKTQGGTVYENDPDSVYYQYWLAMNKDASNIYKGAKVYLDIEVQAMQYRNTSDKEWQTLFSKSYMLTVENAEQGYNSIHSAAGN